MRRVAAMPVNPRQRAVHHHYVRTQRFRQLHGFFSIAGLTLYVDVSFVVKQATKAPANQRVIVNQQYRNFVSHAILSH